MDYRSFLSCRPTCYCLLSSSLLMRLSLLNTIIYIPNPLTACPGRLNTFSDWSRLQEFIVRRLILGGATKMLIRTHLIVFTLSRPPCQQWPQRAQQPIYHRTICISKRARAGWLAPLLNSVLKVYIPDQQCQPNVYFSPDESSSSPGGEIMD